MRSITPVILLSSLLASYGTLAIAQNKGGGAPSGNPSPSSQGAANWNSPQATNRATGQDRAEQRKSEPGKEHNKTADARKKGQADKQSVTSSATPATRATPANPAVPGSQSSPATPATPASPAIPASPANK